MELISVIVPVYNTADYIDNCLSSILKNTYRNLEVICVNDGSTDQSGNHLDEFAEQDSRVHVIHTENHGVSSARNTALSLATGELIVFIDSDDWVHPQYFERLYFSLHNSDSDIAACKYESVIEYHDIPNSNSPIEFSIHHIDSALKIENFKRCVTCKLYRHEVLRNASFTHGISWGEDTLFNLQALSSNENIQVSYLPEPLYFYLQRSTSAVHTVRPESKLYLINWYLKNLNTNISSLNKSLFLKEAMKLLLSFRYEEMIKGTWRKYTKEYTSLRKQAQSQILSTDGFNMIERVVFFIFFTSPRLYRMFRLKNDKTLLIWEKAVKENQKTISL